MERRTLLAAAGFAALTASPARADAPGAPDDERAWAKVRAHFDRPEHIINLEHGNFGAMARPVRRAYEAHVARVNRDTSYYTRRDYPADVTAVRAKAAAALGVAADEIAFTRGATEALQALIGGYARLSPGDGVLYADIDYDAMQTAMRWLKDRRGAEPIAIAAPEPATKQSLIDCYAAAFAAHPNIRLVLLTRVSHRTGLVVPVADIVELARAHGADCIVDAAHAWGQLDETVPDLKADFVGLNAHKWIGAPIGVGIAYIKRSRIADIAPFMGEAEGRGDPIDARIHTGTANFAAYLALADALAFQESIGLPAKTARLRWLRDRWAEPLRADPRFEVLTPADPSLSSALCAFRLRGRTSRDDNAALARTLLDRFGIFTVLRTGLASGACVRVTPSLATRADDIDALSAALAKL